MEHKVIFICSLEVSYLRRMQPGGDVDIDYYKKKIACFLRCYNLAHVLGRMEGQVMNNRKVWLKGLCSAQQHNSGLQAVSTVSDTWLCGRTALVPGKALLILHALCQEENWFTWNEENWMIPLSISDALRVKAGGGLQKSKNNWEIWKFGLSGTKLPLQKSSVNEIFFGDFCFVTFCFVGVLGWWGLFSFFLQKGHLKIKSSILLRGAGKYFVTQIKLSFSFHLT